MKKILTNPITYLVLTAAVLVVVFRKQIADWWNKPQEDKSAPPAEGSACVLNGKAGTVVNGTCVVTEQANRVILVPISSSRIGGRRARCFSKPAGAQCETRIFDSMLGWGTLYSVTNTTCCYIFR